jgi:hypothetical protein
VQLRQKLGGGSVSASSSSAVNPGASNGADLDAFGASAAGSTISRPGGTLIALGMGIGSASGTMNSNSMTRVRTNIQGKAHARGVFEPSAMPTADPVSRPIGTHSP